MATYEAHGNKAFRDVVDDGVEIALATTPEYPAQLRAQLQQAIDCLDGKVDPDIWAVNTLGDIVEFMLCSVARYDRESYPGLIEEALSGLEWLVGLEKL